MSVTIPTFEALTQFGVAQVTTKNTGEVEASYGLMVTYILFHFIVIHAMLFYTEPSLIQYFSCVV